MGQLPLLYILIAVRFFAFFVVFRPLRGYTRLPVVSVLSLSCAFVVCQRCVNYDIAAVASGAPFFITLLWQIGIGVLLAIPFALVIEAVSMSGRLLDVLRGAQTGEQLNPALSGMVSSLESAASLLILTVALLGGAYQLPLNILVRSFDVGLLLPPSPDALLRTQAWALIAPFVQECLRDVTLWVAPLVVFAILSEWGGGYIGRMIPRVSVAAELVPVKLLGGLAVIFLMGYSSGFSAGELARGAWTVALGLGSSTFGSEGR